MLYCWACEFESNGAGSNLGLERLVQGQVIGNRFAGGIGIYCDQVGALLVEQNRMEGNSTGLISSDSAPRIARNEFIGAGLALQVSGTRVPEGVVLNAVRETDHLVNNSAATEMAAAYNWWGEGDEDRIAARMHGRVEWHPFLQSDPKGLPAAASLAQNYPNPFNGSTLIRLVVGVEEAMRARGRDMDLVVRNSGG